MPMRPLPSDGELEILAVLWGRGPSTVRQVHGALPSGRDVSYNTVGKLLQIMTDKGLVAVDSSTRAHVYAAVEAEADVQGRLARDLMRRAFGGSAAQLALRALSREACTPAELGELRALLDALEAEE
ncbi:MAG: BlaI/MecI/CopY family transcriptional regulator [Gemmatimonadota bacterium]